MYTMNVATAVLLAPNMCKGWFEQDHIEKEVLNSNYFT